MRLGVIQFLFYTLLSKNTNKDAKHVKKNPRIANNNIFTYKIVRVFIC